MAHGEARFDWVVPERYNSNSTVNEVFPSLTRMFNNLPKHKRVAIQNSLAKKDLYTSTIDGAWGRNTLIGIGRFTAEHLNTINLKSSENVELVLDAIIEQGDLVRTKVAQPAVFDAVAKRDAGATKVASNSANFKDDYTSQSLLKRQQLQYALKKLGFYSSSIDGLWGSGTSSAIVEYAQANGVNSSSPSSVFSSILSKVDVPSSFEVAKTKVKVQESNAYGLVAIIPNPSVPASQAWAICDPQGDIAAGQAGAANDQPNTT
jgi:hypothetical protein